MRIHVATDHAGLDFSQQLQRHLAGQGHDVVDHGPAEYDALDDYPSFCINAAQAVADDWAAGVEALGVVFGGSGNGEQIAANKVPGVRAALVWNLATATLAREHNNANVISIGARQHTFDEAVAFIDAFIAEPFPGDDRHVRRISQIAEYEQTGDIADKDVLPRSGSAVPVLLQPGEVPPTPSTPPASRPVGFSAES
ncbi:ribose-5-phosphate isomerase [Pseudoclavibacter endophyticus]|uniref:Ribose-5-phosphate isomerase B n=1 Tax=Pseudoclavibacter endophyticus TaxID=1778590 RepID=A0A6H9WLX2_9MICO|nr:ribose-5-phosphate isomerase [Pseudoclavibacter endophyticus]KAB1646730.1 ribose-5-phosphate isomerase [Pseudoclavibacter endophyticus]GGA76042.1 ribose-5-phosphate isomerase [Pseudoclavibacter endophyticus]